MKKALILLSLTLLGYGGKAQQQAMYTQYMFNTLAINPAYPTLDRSLTITALSRHQWVGFDGAPKTQSLSMHSGLGTSNTFLGALLMNDQIGETLRETGINGSLSQRVEIAEDVYIAVGVNGGVSSYQANFSDKYNLSPESVNDPAFSDHRKTRANVGFGIMYFDDQYYVGLASPHFYTKDLSSSITGAQNPVNSHYLLHFGALYSLGEVFKIKPNFLIQYTKGAPIQTDINTNLLIKETVWLGVSYRSLSYINALASIFITPAIQLGYSYDFAGSNPSKLQQSSHEIMLKFRIARDDRNALPVNF